MPLMQHQRLAVVLCCDVVRIRGADGRHTLQIEVHAIWQAGIYMYSYLTLLVTSKSLVMSAASFNITHVPIPL